MNFFKRLTINAYILMAMVFVTAGVSYKYHITDDMTCGKLVSYVETNSSNIEAKYYALYENEYYHFNRYISENELTAKVNQCSPINEGIIALCILFMILLIPLTVVFFIVNYKDLVRDV